MSLQCRVCLQFSKNCTYLFTECHGVTLAEIIQFCADIKIADVGDLPSHVCLACSKDAEVAYKFVKNCRQSDHALQTQKPVRNTMQAARTEELLVEFISDDQLQDRTDDRRLSDELVEETVVTPCDANDDYSTTGDVPATDDIYAIEYLDEDESQLSNELIRIQKIEEDTDLTTLNNQPVSDSNYYCCHSHCMLTFDTKNELKVHINSQHVLVVGEQDIPGAPNSCNNCDLPFSSEKEFDMHYMLLQLKKSIIKPEGKGRPRTFPCVFDAELKKCCDCYTSFPTIELLLDHAIKRHSIRKTIQDPTRSVRCELCFKLFRSKMTLRMHQNAPYKPCNYSCDLCGASYTTKSRLEIHQVTHRTVRKFKCFKCGASFKNEQNLNTHALVHWEKKEVCSTCGLRFHRKCNLRMHQRTHTDAYYAACPHCDKRYKNQSQLKEHVKVHTKDKPFECRYCPERFTYTSDCKRHEMAHTGKYPFTCGCSKKFSRNSLYMQHHAKCKQNDDGDRVF